MIWLPIRQSLSSLMLSKCIQMIDAKMLGNNLHFRKVEKSLKARITYIAKTGQASRLVGVNS